MDEKEKLPKFTYEELKSKYIDQNEVKPQSQTKELATNLNLILSFIFNVLILSFAGIFIGLFIDNKLNTKPLFIIILTLLGLGGAFRNLMKSVVNHGERSLKDKDGSK